MPSSVIPLSLLALGMIVGLFVKFPPASIAISILLYILILLVGIVLGREGASLKIGDLKIPILTLIGTLASGIIISPVVGLPVNVSAAISAGLGWYTLAGPLITKACGAKIGIIAFISNLLREMITLTMARTISERIGCDSLAASGAAPCMDTLLPFIAQVCDHNGTMKSFISGLVLTIIAPLLIPLLLSL
ncbi:MAG: lysine exporter LysO family protein [Candidatus Methanodesulfokora sp.]